MDLRLFLSTCSHVFNWEPYRLGFQAYSLSILIERAIENAQFYQTNQAQLKHLFSAIDLLLMKQTGEPGGPVNSAPSPNG